MSFSGEVTITGDVIEALRARLSQRRAALQAGGEALERAKDAVFDVEGPAWAPLAPSTVEARGSAHPILHETGRLQASYRAVYADDAVALVSDDPRAPLHQQGTARMPARPVALPEPLIRGAARDVATRLLRGGA